MPSKRPAGRGMSSGSGSGSGNDNGNGQVSANPPKRQKTAEKAQLTIEEKNELREWLDNRERDPKLASIFTVQYSTMSHSKRGKESTPLVEQLSLGGEDHMAVAYSVTPAKQWSQLHRYRKFTLPNGETHEQGSCIFVKHGDSGDNFDLEKQWKAQVLEVRALDENHVRHRVETVRAEDTNFHEVYLRVVWLEIPNELPSGRKSYHASNELVVSNEMYIIDAQTVNGGLEVVHWDETNDEVPPPEADVYFWRQRYDKNTSALSKLREICRCETPHNPNDLIVRCSSCASWLHARCIIEAAETLEVATVADARHPNGVAESKGSRQKKRLSGGAAKQRAKKKEHLKIEIAVAEGGKPKLLIKGKAVEDVLEKEVQCLVCKEVMD